jgi:hypothetical protein
LVNDRHCYFDTFALPGVVGALIHILPVIAVIFIVIWLLTGKKLWK